MLVSLFEIIQSIDIDECDKCCEHGLGCSVMKGGTTPCYCPIDGHTPKWLSKHGYTLLELEDEKAKEHEEKMTLWQGYRI